jgi:hypothetical protein
MSATVMATATTTTMTEVRAMRALKRAVPFP